MTETEFEKNMNDLRRMKLKRAQALRLVDEFKEWYCKQTGELSEDEQIVIMGLTRDILRGTESEVDRLTELIDERNQQALMRKLERQ